MSQHTFDNFDADERDTGDLPAIFNALHSNHIGTARPSYVQKGMVWSKEIGNPMTSIQEYLYDGSNDILLREHFATGRIRTYFSNDGDQWIEADPSGNDLIIGAGNSARFQFTNDGDLIPETDGVSDIGGTAKRVKDIFLSGGLYLGGSGAANKLDDYEEGTWTPTARGGSTAGTASYIARSGRYTKIGRLVILHCTVSFSLSGHSGQMEISGLPFSASGEGAVGTFQCNQMGSSYGSSVGQYTAIIQDGNSWIHFRGTKTNGSLLDFMPSQSLTYLRVGIMYTTA